EGTIIADFGPRSLDVNLPLSIVDGDDATHWRTLVDDGATFWTGFRDGYTFNVPLATLEDPALKGVINGQFFCPAAEEIAGVFQIGGLNQPTTDIEAAGGAFVGGRAP